MTSFGPPAQDARTPLSQQPKAMSSRLLNMKFMQRATAASPTTSTLASTPRTPATEPSNKRRRVDGTNTSSPAISIPGTPTNEARSGQTTPITGRGGISSFSRVEGADTDWVLNVNMPAPERRVQRPLQKDTANHGMSGMNGSTSRFGALANGHEEIEVDSAVDEEDIWAPAQPTGRQTFGSFKKRKARVVPQAVDNDEDLSPASDSDDDSESDNDSNSDSPSESFPNGARAVKTPTRHRNQAQTKSTDKDADSDDEMLQVRQAMELKHRTQMYGADAAKRGVGDKRNTSSRNWDHSNRVTKRKGGRDQGSYKRKKARKTI